MVTQFINQLTSWTFSAKIWANVSPIAWSKTAKYLPHLCGDYLNIWFEYLNSCHIYQVTIWVFEYLLYLSGDYLSQSFSPPLSGIRTNIKLPTRKVLPTNISNLPFMRWYFNKKFGNEQEFEYILQWYWKALNLLQQLVSKVFLQSLSQVRKLINHEGIWIPIITIRFSSRYETVIS